MATAFALSVLLMLFGSNVIAWMLGVRIGVRWAKLSTTWRRIFRLTAFVFGFTIVGYIAGLAIYEWGLPEFLALFLGIAILALPIVLIRYEFSSTVRQTLKIWLPTLLTGLIPIVLALVIKAFVLEAFVIPSNAMAPTLVGDAQRGTCPECGTASYVSPRHVETLRAATSRPVYAICENFHSTPLSREDLPLQPSSHLNDRLLVNQLLKPARWDLLVFVAVNTPELNYTKRVVGLMQRLP